MQQPTCTNVRIRSTNDAHKIFSAVQQKVLHMVTRRLDADERLALRSGCVYAWEERGPHSELTGLGIERFTEGRRWSPSRVRDEFLFYYEKYAPAQDSSNSSNPQERQPPREWDPLVKQTYSVWVETDKGRRKWHLTAYFTQATIDHLGTIDDDPRVKDIIVPPGMFKSTRVSKGSKGKSDDPNRSDAARASVSRTYASFPGPYQYQGNGSPNMTPVLMHEPYQTSRSPYDHSPSPVSPQEDSSHSAPQHRIYSLIDAGPSLPYSDQDYSSSLAQNTTSSSHVSRMPIGIRAQGKDEHTPSPQRTSTWQDQSEYYQGGRYDPNIDDSKTLLQSNLLTSYGTESSPQQQPSMTTSAPQNTYGASEIAAPRPSHSHDIAHNMYSQPYSLDSTFSTTTKLPPSHMVDPPTYPLSPLQIPDARIHNPYVSSPAAHALPLHSTIDYHFIEQQHHQNDSSQEGGLVPLAVLRRPIKYPRDPIDERSLRLL